MSETTVECVSVSIDQEAGGGWMYVHPDASASDILAALEAVDEAGFEALDPFETGDEPEIDRFGRQMIPVVRKWP